MTTHAHLLVPKLVTSLQNYDRTQFLGDLTAGVIVGVVALPLAIAFAIASGVTPDRGLWTAIIAGFIISALGGSRVQIGGPTGAFVVIVYGIVQKYGIDGLTVATLMAGVFLVIMGLARAGSMIRFIPQPLITGFTSGIAVIIFSGEIKDLLGLHMGTVPAGFVEKLDAYFRSASGVSPAAIGLSMLALAIILLWPHVNRRIPGTFVALIVTTVLVTMMHLPVETIGARFGAISASIPQPQMPHLSFAQTTSLVGPALTIAFLAAIESLLSAVVADGMTGGRHRSNMELVAQGVANMVTPLFGGIPATGAIARTATNVKNGGRTPVAGIIHALTLLVITLFIGRWAALIPMATLAAILVVVSYHMSEWRNFASELRSPKSDVAVLLTTFGLTVLVDLTVAISVGLILAAFLFIRRMATVTTVTDLTRPADRNASSLADDGDGAEWDEAGDRYIFDPDGVRRREVPAGVEVYEVAGPFFFGVAAMFKDTLARVAGKPKVLIIRMRDVPALDSTALRALSDVVHRTRKDGTTVLLSGVHMQPLVALAGSQVLTEVGEANMFPDLDSALVRARELVTERERASKG
ncbi:MAG: SulP family inorganic anion transporter [Gemmatimonadota bacterium]|nr:SulP family inorganic anion transporter [Gemmatimonadota bacterium]